MVMQLLQFAQDTTWNALYTWVRKTTKDNVLMYIDGAIR